MNRRCGRRQAVQMVERAESFIPVRGLVVADVVRLRRYIPFLDRHTHGTRPMARIKHVRSPASKWRTGLSEGRAAISTKGLFGITRVSRPTVMDAAALLRERVGCHAWI